MVAGLWQARAKTGKTGWIMEDSSVTLAEAPGGNSIATLRPVRLDARPDAQPRPDLIAGRRVLFVMAAPEEYGPALRQRITPLMTGIGPVEAAVTVAAALAGLAAKRELPAMVVCLGSAGSRHLEQGGVYQAASVSYRDMDVSALGFPPGITPGLDLPA